MLKNRNNRTFSTTNDGFASVESSRTRDGAFSGSGEPYRDRILGQTPLDWQDCRIIPDITTAASFHEK